MGIPPHTTLEICEMDGGSKDGWGDWGGRNMWLTDREEVRERG